VDLEDSMGEMPGIRYIKGNITSIDVPDGTVDVAISRAVIEHVLEPDLVFREMKRILKPGGSFIFLVPNLGDYVSIMSLLIPNRFHKYIVSKTEGREMEDVFPAYYKANTYTAIRRLSMNNGFEIADFQWLGQYPSIFMFNAFLFYLATGYEKIISRYEFFRSLRGWLLVQLVSVEPLR
ncbi:MAG: class I SAM-dependent methyltransferase, partial [Sedimentisphaerales bacterium]|nr:class I SAM-dependent methyltransferase [Sedimentisphaerales bacterium]